MICKEQLTSTAASDLLKILTQMLDAHKGTSSAISQSLYARQVTVSPQHLPKGQWPSIHRYRTIIVSWGGNTKVGDHVPGVVQSPWVFPINSVVHEQTRVSCPTARALHVQNNPSQAALKATHMERAGLTLSNTQVTEPLLSVACTWGRMYLLANRARIEGSGRTEYGFTA